MQLPTDFDLKQKRVLVRTDFNVPLDEKGRILDDFRIKRTLPTLRYLRDQNAKIILISHLSAAGSLRKIGQRLVELLDQKIIFVKDCRGKQARKEVQKMEPGQIVLLENLREYPEEKEGDLGFAKELAQLGEIFLNDAFSVSHREHASVVGISQFLPSGAGLALDKEIDTLSEAKEQPERPLTVILGGIKVPSKISTVPLFLKKVDHLLLNTVMGEALVGAKSLTIKGELAKEQVSKVAQNIELANPKLHLPLDGVVCLKKDRSYSRIAPLGKIRKEELMLDIGPQTKEVFAEIVRQSRTVVWSGPLGKFEEQDFAQGTKLVAKTIVDQQQLFSVVGGGETCLALKQFGLGDQFSFVSTGGGAMLQFVAGETLPGLEVLG